MLSRAFSAIRRAESLQFADSGLRGGLGRRHGRTPLKSGCGERSVCWSDSHDAVVIGMVRAKGPFMPAEQRKGKFYKDL
jgi:hypothetical protein